MERRRRRAYVGPVAPGHDDLVTETLEVGFESPDLVHIRRLRRFAAPEIALMYPAIRRFAAVSGHVLTLVDISQLASVRSDDREAAYRETLTIPFRGTAVIGANPTLRIVLDLAFRALRLISKQDHPLRFFADEAAARAWLAERRAVVAGERA
jgi:hypothetical protein